MSSRTGGGDGAAASNVANPAGTVQGVADDTGQRVEEDDIREGDVSDEERGEQDGLHSGFTSPQGQGGSGGARTRRGVASRGSAPPRASRQIGGIDPQRWGRSSKDETGAPKRKRKDQRERARQELTSRLAASLSASSRTEQRSDADQAAEGVDLDDREWASAGGSASGADLEVDSQGFAAQRGSRGKRSRVAQLDPPQPKDDPLLSVISSRMTARPNWKRQGGFASLMQEITQGMNASDAPTVDELLLVAEGSVEFLFGTSRAALLQISSPLPTSESKAWLSAQNVDAKLAKLGQLMLQALKHTLYFYSFQKPFEEYALRTSILRMFLDHLVKPPNPTEMMCHRGIRVENCLCSIRRSIEGLMRLGKDWILMLLPCLFLSPEVFNEDWIQRLANQVHSCPLCVQCVGFQIQS